MARIKITLPPVFQFSTKIPVRITDVNYGGHVGNDAFLSILHEARLQFLAHFGYSELELAGTSLIMADAAIKFKKEAFYGDTIIASVAVDDFQRVAFDIVYKLEKEQEGQLVPVAFAKTGVICYDYTQKKICPVPEAAIKLFQSVLK